MASVNVIEAKFRRAGLKPNHTLLWSKSDVDVKEPFQKVKLEQSEQCIILYSTSSAYSWVFTNQRLIVIDRNEIAYYPYTAIKDVLFPTIDEIKGGKSEIDHLRLTLTGGDTITLFVERSTWHFIYALIKFLRTGNSP